MARGVWAALLGVSCAALGGWAGQRLGGDPATAGTGVALGAVTGAFAPSITSWVTSRTTAREEAARTAELPRDVHQPSKLLDPHRQTVAFTGRDADLADLTAWCENDSSPRVRLITAPGGTGKTRLALQSAHYAQQLGWRCQWVGDGQEATALPGLRADTSSRLLLIVDYAETRTSLPSLLRHVVSDSGAAIRVLLLARSAGPWWEQLGAGEAAIRDIITAAGPHGHTLTSALTSDLNDEQLVRQAIPAFARAAGLPPPQHVTITTKPGRATVLELHAAALVAVLDAGPDPSTPVRVSLSSVLDDLLQHEERFWIGTATRHQLLEGPAGLTYTALRQIVAAACLLGATSDHDLLDLLRRVPSVPPTMKTAEWLRSLYPAPHGSGLWLGTLQPDRLAERHTIAQLTASPALAHNCLTGLNDKQARNAIILLARAATDHATARKYLAQLLPLVSGVLADLQAPHEVLVSIANTIPYPSIILAPAHATITRKILDTLPAATHPAQRARWLDIRGVTLAQMGQPAQALSPTQEAVTIRRELAAVNPGRYRPDLAASLNNLGVRLAALGRPQDALPPTEEAVTIRRELATTNPGRYRPDLIQSLANLARSMSSLGHEAEAQQARLEIDGLTSDDRTKPAQ